MSYSVGMDNKKRLARIGWTFMVLSVLFGGVALWWWALAGMSQQVQSACLITTVFLGIFAMGFGFAADTTVWSPKEDEEDESE